MNAKLIQLANHLSDKRMNIIRDAMHAHGLTSAVGHGGLGVLGLEVDCPDRPVVNGLSIKEFLQVAPQHGIECEYRNGILIAGGWLNSYVNTGLNNNLDRESGAGGTAIGFLGVDCDTSAVTAATVYLHGSATAANGTNTVASGATAGGTTVTLSAGAVPSAGAGFTFQGGTAETLQVLSVAGQVVTFATALQSTHANASAVAWTGALISAATNSRTNQTTTYLGPTWTLASFASGGSSQAPKCSKVGLLNTSTDAGTGLIDVIGGSGSGIYSRTYGVDLTYQGSFNFQAGIAVTAVAV